MARRGVAGFAEGLLAGYSEGTRIQQQRELHELQVAKARDERAMNAEFKALDTAAKVNEGYVVTTPDGNRTVFADKAMAEEAAQAFGEKAQLEQKFIVAGKQFDNKEAADVAADAANAPAARLRQRAEIALKYNRPDLADAYTKNYNNMLEANRRDLQESFLEAQSTGDYNAVLDAYNKRLPNGATAQMVPNEQGGMTMQVTKNGQVVTQKPFASPDEFWTTMGQQIAQTPDNMLETWKTREQMKAQTRGLDIQERKVNIDEAEGKARIAQGWAGLDIQGRKADSDIKNDAARTRIASGQLGVAQGELGLKSSLANRPDVISGVNPTTGNVVIGATERYRDPETKQWGLRVLPSQEIPGMAPTRTAGPADPLAAMLGAMGGAPAPLTVDWSKVPPKNLGGATPPVAPARGMAPPARTVEDWQRRQNLIDQIPK